MRIDARLCISAASNDDEDASMKHTVIASCSTDLERVFRIICLVMTRANAIIRPIYVTISVIRKASTRVKSDEAVAVMPIQGSRAILQGGFRFADLPPALSPTDPHGSCLLILETALSRACNRAATLPLRIAALPPFGEVLLPKSLIYNRNNLVASSMQWNPYC